MFCAIYRALVQHLNEANVLDFCGAAKAELFEILIKGQGEVEDCRIRV